MTFFGMALIAAAGTVVLAAFAIVTAWYARRAFLKQSQEVAAIERQVSDGQELARQQAELLKVQSGQMELQREQLAAQTVANDIQADATARQAEERARQAEQARRAQAARVFLTESPFKGRVDRSMAAYDESIGMGPKPPSITATVHNTSDQPIYDADLYWHQGSMVYPTPVPVGTLLPGATFVGKRDFSRDTNLGVSGAVLHFRDAAGTRWTRRPDGYLEEQQP
jgi:hypothetical protein